MSAFSPRKMSRSNVFSGRLWRRTLVSLLCLPCMQALALDAPEAGSRAGSYVPEVSTTSLPGFDAIDGGSRSSRIDLSLVPARRSGLGLMMGLTTLDANAPVSAGFTSTQNVDFGLRWSHTLDSNYRIDVTAWRRVTPDAATLISMRQPSYGASVEMQISSIPRSGFVAERGFLGVQLQGGARITVRRSGGKPMVYYRTKF